MRVVSGKSTRAYSDNECADLAEPPYKLNSSAINVKLEYNAFRSLIKYFKLQGTLCSFPCCFESYPVDNPDETFFLDGGFMIFDSSICVQYPVANFKCYDLI